MGAGGVSAAVVDAGPLIHLNEIGGLALLHLFEVLHIPNAAWSETVDRGRVREVDLVGLSNVRWHILLSADVARFVHEHSLETLQAGDTECLYLYQQLSIFTLLTDDLSVREAAKRQSLTPVGSLGVVVRAYRRGIIALAEAEWYITALYDTSSLFVTRALVDMAIAQLRRHADQG